MHCVCVYCGYVCVCVWEKEACFVCVGVWVDLLYSCVCNVCVYVWGRDTERLCVYGRLSLSWEAANFRPLHSTLQSFSIRPTTPPPPHHPPTSLVSQMCHVLAHWQPSETMYYLPMFNEAENRRAHLKGNGDVTGDEFITEHCRFIVGGWGCAEQQKRAWSLPNLMFSSAFQHELQRAHKQSALLLSNTLWCCHQLLLPFLPDKCSKCGLRCFNTNKCSYWGSVCATYTHHGKLAQRVEGILQHTEGLNGIFT